MNPSLLSHRQLLRWRWKLHSGSRSIQQHSSIPGSSQGVYGTVQHQFTSPPPPPLQFPVDSLPPPILPGPSRSIPPQGITLPKSPTKYTLQAVDVVLNKNSRYKNKGSIGRLALALAREAVLGPDVMATTTYDQVSDGMKFIEQTLRRVFPHMHLWWGIL